MLSLKAEKRIIFGRKTNQLRKKGIIPAIVYGHGIESRSVSVIYSDFKKIYQQAGKTSLINLIIDNEEPIQVLIHNIQRHPLTDEIIHIDFYQVKAEEKITIEIELKFVGEAPAVKELGGVLITPLDKIKVECLPKDLVHEIEVDISKLKTFEDIIRVKDLVPPRGIKFIESADEVIALVKPPRIEEELKVLEEKPVERVEEVEVIKEKPKEESKE